MAYILGDITLKDPVGFIPTIVETSAVHTTMNGRSVKDIRNIKMQYTLQFQSLTAAQVSQILGEYALKTVRDFSVNETNLTIAATPVHISIAGREYIKGGEYRENMTLILTEEA